MQHEGVPASLTLEAARDWIRPRLTDKRYNHSCGVGEVASEIAKHSGACDCWLAELGGILHDCCKEIKDRELVTMAQGFGLPLDPILETHGHLLHAPVGAEVAKRELKINNPELYDAIAEHTLGNVPMSGLSKVLFLADCLEESRPKNYTAPIWKALDLKGECNLERAIVVATEAGFTFLIEDGKPIHPRSVEVRNYYLHAPGH